MAKITWQNRIVAEGVKPASQFMAHPKNWRKHPQAQRDALRGALNEIGWVQRIVENVRTGHLIDGHERVWQALQNDDADVPYIQVDLSEEEEAYVLATLDPIGAMAQADATKLDELLQDVQSGEAGIQAMLAELAEEAGLYQEPKDRVDPGAQIDRAEELQEKWQTAVGQLWQVGQHQILCDDCTNPEAMARILDGNVAQLAITSPPYGVGKSYEAKGIAPWFETVRPAIQNLCQHAKVVVWQLVDLYSTGSQHIEPTMAYSINMFAENGFKVIWIRIWEKPGINFGVGPYHLVSNKPAQQYEYVAALGSDDNIDMTDVTDFEWVLGFAGHGHKFVKRLSKADRKEWGYAGVWRMNTVVANKDHPAMFPLELPERCIKMHSDPGDIVMDPFGGAGTTMVACERLGRRGRSMELDPKYVAVSLERMAGMGLEPRLIGSENPKG